MTVERERVGDDCGERESSECEREIVVCVREGRERERSAVTIGFFQKFHALIAFLCVNAQKKS